MKKILFNDKYGLTQAVLEGRKTQTRRIISRKTLDKIGLFQKEYYGATFDKLEGVELLTHYFITEKLGKLPYNIGKVVSVAQSYKDVDSYYSAAYQRQHSIRGMIVDALDCVSNEDIKKWFKNRNDFKDKASWNNKMFVKPEYMPHQIHISNVRIERLQEISDDDCLKEGLEWDGVAHKYYVNYDKTNGSKTYFKASPKESYAELIDKVSGKGTWESNPYVFVYEFNLIK